MDNICVLYYLFKRKLVTIRKDRKVVSKWKTNPTNITTMKLKAQA